MITYFYLAHCCLLTCSHQWKEGESHSPKHLKESIAQWLLPVVLSRKEGIYQEDFMDY
jgi:hypothetical protein